VAFAEILVGDGPLSPAERDYLVEHIERRTTQGGGYYLELYRTSVGLLERLAGTRFSGLDFSRRLALITHNRLSSSTVRPEETLGRFPRGGLGRRRVQRVSRNVRRPRALHEL